MSSNIQTTTTTVPTQNSNSSSDVQSGPKDCLTCRIIGTAALAGTGVYALNQSRAHAPGSIIGKRIMAGVGICFLVGSAFRWTK
ncbi:hypothetical protein C8Q75DRAFT_725843 [Abortiporus biennis]|nr:hypothetical protein C8Q75DRAFT_725843 [Abortiporus biennis]